MAGKYGNKFVSEYANHLKSFWMELDHYKVIKTNYVEDATVLKETIEQDMVYDFFVGLNPKFNQGSNPWKTRSSKL